METVHFNSESEYQPQIQKKTKELLKYFKDRPAQSCTSYQTISHGQLVRLFRNIQNVKRPSITLSLELHLASWSEDEEGGFSMI